MADSGFAVPYNKRLKRLNELLARVRRPGDFFVRGLIESPVPRLEIERLGTVSFPVPQQQAKALVELSERAPYGRGEETLVDTRVRKVWQLAPSKLRLGGKTWPRTLDRILATVTEGLGCGSANVRAELYKLLVYDRGSFVGIDVRGLLRALGFDPGERRLGDLGPPQKTRRLNKRGRTLKITTTLLVQGSCGIGRPFGDEKVLRRYLSERQHTKLRRRLEADAKSLFALYEYGRLHGAVRLRWGFLDEMLPVPWVHRDEPTLYHLKQQTLERGIPLEVVVGSAPGWSDPWSRRQLAFVAKEPGGWRSWIVNEGGFVVDEAEIQRARLADSAPGPR